MSEIRVLINASSCVVGGGVQVSMGFIREAIRSAAVRRWKIILATSPFMAELLKDEAQVAAVEVVSFSSPGVFFTGRRARRELRRLASDWNADIVFTIFGPSYVRFPVPEYMGMAEPFAIAPCPGCYANHSWPSACSAWLKGNAKRFLLRTGRRFWVETESAKAGLCRRARIGPDRVDVVPNGVNAAFAAALRGGASSEDFEILMLGAGYPHKNHAIIPRVARRLIELRPDSPWRFVVTLPDDSPIWMTLRRRMDAQGMPDRLVNRGPLTLAECAAAYESATVIFHPSLLEIFSAGYVEAMAASRPLIVSDRPFAREICGDAPAYVDPLDATASAEMIARLLDSPGDRAALVAKGAKRLKVFPDAAEKNGRLCDLLDEFADRHCAAKF